MHIGVDKDTGIIHTVITTPANVHDVTKADELRRPDDWEVVNFQRFSTPYPEVA